MDMLLNDKEVIQKLIEEREIYLFDRKDRELVLLGWILAKEHYKVDDLTEDSHIDVDSAISLLKSKPKK